MAAKKEAQAEKPGKKTCFVIMPFSDPDGYECGHFRNIYEYTFAPAIRAAGYEPLRIDDNIVSSLIHGKMMNELINAPMVLCDLSTNNPNVLYELGIRHAFDKPVVLVQEMGQDRIFDIGAITSVEYHPSRLYEEVVEDQKRITEAILQNASAKSAYSIMSLANLHSAKATGDKSVTSETQMNYLLQEVSKLSQKVRAMETKSADRYPEMPYDQTSTNWFRKQELDRKRAEENRLDLEREYRLDELNEMVDTIHNLLSNVKRPSAKQLEEWNAMLWQKVVYCKSVGVAPSKLDSALDMRDKLSSMLREAESANRLRNTATAFAQSE